MNNTSFPIHISFKNVYRFLQVIVLCSIVLGLISVFLSFYVYRDGEPHILVHKFGMDTEMSIPTYFSSMNLFIASVVLSFIAINKRKFRHKYFFHWLALSVIFLGLSLDEMIGMHEFISFQFISKMKLDAPIHHAWSVIGSLFIMVFLFCFAKFFFMLPAKTRKEFFIAGLLFVSGSLGVEAISGFVIINNGRDLLYNLFVIIEETFEMIGILLFIKALFNYISDNLNHAKLSRKKVLSHNWSVQKTYTEPV